MDILLVGGGGREAALAWKLAQSPDCGRIWVDSDNPGFPARAQRLPPGELVEQALAQGVGLVVIGPEAPLAEGLVDRCRALGLPAFGPTKAAARLESSKAWAKSFMDRHDIPTARFEVFEGADEALTWLEHPAEWPGGYVVKLDGLAAGKGVVVCESAGQAREAVRELAGAGGGFVVEERLVGEELSVLALCDGERFVLLPPAQDHKQRFDGDQGPNTGGMGAYAPVPAATPALLGEVVRTVIEPTLLGMAAEGAAFTGVLYVGLMLTAEGPRVLEYNCRFGDPECQPVVMLLAEDLLPLLLDCALGRLQPRPLAQESATACCVVMVSEGYPGSYPKGLPITGLEQDHDGVVVFQAGTREVDGTLVTAGGRVLGVTALGSDLQQARERAYQAVETIHFPGAGWRRDIGARKA